MLKYTAMPGLHRGLRGHGRNARRRAAMRPVHRLRVLLRLHLRVLLRWRRRLLLSRRAISSRQAAPTSSGVAKPSELQSSATTSARFLGSSLNASSRIFSTGQLTSLVYLRCPQAAPSKRCTLRGRFQGENGTRARRHALHGAEHREHRPDLGELTRHIRHRDL